MIFVTGGTGLLGNSIIRELCRRGQRVRGLCRPGTDRAPFDGLDVEIISGDLSQPDVLQRAIDGCSAVIHSAALIHIGWQKLAASRAANVEGTRMIAQHCARHGARLVHISTVDTLPAAIDKAHPIDELGGGGVPKTRCTYVVSKTEAETEVRRQHVESGLDAVIIHPGFMLGPFDWKPSSGRMMLEVNRTPIVAAPPGGCSVCDARDVAASIVNALDMGKSGENYILAGENLSYVELWQKMLQISGRRRRVYRLGSNLRFVGSTIDTANRWLPIRERDVNGAMIAMGSLNHFYDSSKARAELDYQSRPLEATLADAWQWLNKTNLRS